MTSTHHVRQATEADLPFLVEAAIVAELSGTDILSYSTLYGLSLDETKVLLSEMIKEDIPGQELALCQFSILDLDGRPAACISTWIEGEHGESGQLKSTLLGFYIPIEKLNKAAVHKTLLHDLRIERMSGALQVECVYVAPEFRGKGLLKPLLEQIIQDTTIPSGKVQLIVDGSNEKAIRAYEKIGFKGDKSVKSNHALSAGILPSPSRCSMILDI